MGMDAELLAIGKFNHEIAPWLDYHPSGYSKVPDGSTIITRIATCGNTKSSMQLAEALGVDPWAFEQHCELIGNNIDEELFAEATEGGDEDLKILRVLRAYSFKFYYLPNG